MSFLDQNSQKISKTKGNGLSIEEWLAYAPPESLEYFMYQSPRRANQAPFFDVIPRYVDDYFAHLKAFSEQTPAQQIKNPVWHVHQGSVPSIKLPLSFHMLLNLASVCHAEDKAVLCGFIARYAPGASRKRCLCWTSWLGMLYVIIRILSRPIKNINLRMKWRKWPSKICWRLWGV